MHAICNLKKTTEGKVTGKKCPMVSADTTMYVNDTLDFRGQAQEVGTHRFQDSSRDRMWMV